MAKLTEPQQRFIVQALAMWDTPSQVAAAVKERYGVEISKQAAAHYDAETNQKDLSPKWMALFWETRKAFVEETTKLPVAHRAARIRMLQRYVERLESVGNYVAAAQLLEQAAKEMGDAFTNTRNLQGRMSFSFEDILAAAEAADAAGEAE